VSGEGKIILLNGASSSGKSSIAQAVQEIADRPLLHWSIDHMRAAGVLPLDRFRSGDFRWPEHREAFFAGFHASLEAFARHGNDLLVEHIVETSEWMRRLVDLLDGFDVSSLACTSRSTNWSGGRLRAAIVRAAMRAGTSRRSTGTAPTISWSMACGPPSRTRR
jgi:chloramphenicol 3-O-phosphotransferase